MTAPASFTAAPWTWPATMSPPPTSTTTLANLAPALAAMTLLTWDTTQRARTIACAERLRCLRTVVRRGASARVKGNATSNTLHRAPSSASMEYSATPLQPLGFTELRPGGHRGGSMNDEATGGLGAYITGEFMLQEGQDIFVLVGQQGIVAESGSGGGGGTFVTTGSTPREW